MITRDRFILLDGLNTAPVTDAITYEVQKTDSRDEAPMPTAYRKPTDKILDLDISQHLAWQRAHPGEVDWGPSPGRRRSSWEVN